MTDILEGFGERLSSASLLRALVCDYSRGRYTDVVSAWQKARATGPDPAWLSQTDIAEAVGWSVALTKAWDAYPALLDDLRPHPAHASLVALLEAWYAIHEGRYDAALLAARTARSPHEGVGIPARILAFGLKVEGVAQFRMGRYREAEELTRSALDLFRLIVDPLNVSHCATNLGLVLNARGELPAARAALQQSLDALLDAQAADERLALARVNLAVVELHLGHVDAARALFESSRLTFESLGLRSERITALNGLGHCDRALGQFESALAHHRMALRLAGTDLPRQLGLGHEFLGQVHFDRGDTTRAERHYRRALEIASNIAPDGDLMLEICWHLAELLVASGRCDEAEEFVERAESLCAASEERRELGCVQRARARVLAASGDRRAAGAFQVAFETLRQTGRVFESVLTLLAHAEAQAAAHDVDRAESLLARARELLEERIPASRWMARLDALSARWAEQTASSTPAVRYGFVTRDPELVGLLEDLPAMAASPYPVLLEGESGTGKELLARAVHGLAQRRGGWVALNCAAVPRELFESELFGHVRGAFSGASIEKPGLFEQADNGTLFLDEIGDMPLDLQVKLLRVLDDGLVRRIGDVRERAVRVKVVAATNKPLEPMVEDGRFRTDLYHRLAVHSLRVKPLRERSGDVELLARHLLDREDLAAKLPWTSELLAELETRAWPGNVRELRNVLVRMALQRRRTPSLSPSGAKTQPSLRATRSSHERRVIEAALSASHGNVAVAARELRLHVTTLRRKMRTLAIQRPE
jgi:transcriptional regulator with PAS, ATPase and Fis domain